MHSFFTAVLCINNLHCLLLAEEEPHCCTTWMKSAFNWRHLTFSTSCTSVLVKGHYILIQSLSHCHFQASLNNLLDIVTAPPVPPLKRLFTITLNCAAATKAEQMCHIKCGKSSQIICKCLTPCKDGERHPHFPLGIHRNNILIYD